MKQLLKISAFVLTMAFGLNAEAQNKFGHINSDELLMMMPETEVAQNQLKQYNTELEAQLQEMYGEYQKKVNELQTGGEMMTDMVKQTKLKNLQDLETRINEFQQNAQQSFQQKEVELLTPVIEKAQNAINAVAEAEGFTYIFDTSKGVVLYAVDSQDIMDLVKKQLGLQ